MGKRSKNKKKTGNNVEGGHRFIPGTGGGPIGNEIPLYRKSQPELFKTFVDEINPILRFNAGQTWPCIDDDSFYSTTRNESGEIVIERHSVRQNGVIAECPLCFAPAYENCSVCWSVFYCSKDCQKKHWKQCHKKACKPKPHLYRFKIDIDQFKSLPQDAFEGHEFILIKPTEKLSSLEQICDVCLEPADDVFDKVQGFGCDQTQPLWALNNSNHTISKAIRSHFGWTSSEHGISTLEGYRHSEDHFVYMVMYDDNFLHQKDMDLSYYGDACFPWARENKHVRGNILIYKLYIKNKRRVERNRNIPFIFICSDDDDLQHEFELYPITKCEIALMLRERREAIEQGKYTRRQWRYVIRREERKHESGAIVV